MDYLRAAADELGLERVLKAVSEYDTVQGAVLTLDEWWLAAWRLNDSRALSDWRWFWTLRYPFLNIPGPELPWIPRRQPDLSWTPPGWEGYSEFIGGRPDMSPVRLIICFRPPIEGEKLPVFEFKESRLAISYEVRALARFAGSTRETARPLIGGVSIGTGSNVFGTLGGIVKDGTGATFGSTCAHVFPTPASVDQPARYDRSKAGAIGTSTPITNLQACSSPTPCNPYVSSGHIVSNDTALIAIKNGIGAVTQVLSIGPISGLVSKNSMSTGQDIEFVGRTSGHRIAEIGGLAVFYRLGLGSSRYCFKDLFEVRWRHHARELFGPVVQAGDSGAWVCAPTASGMGWCGQIIGEDRGIGYATFAENTIAAWAAAGRNLNP